MRQYCLFRKNNLGISKRYKYITIVLFLKSNYKTMINLKLHLYDLGEGPTKFLQYESRAKIMLIF
jgi:hypothetical protein